MLFIFIYFFGFIVLFDTIFKAKYLTINSKTTMLTLFLFAIMVGGNTDRGDYIMYYNLFKESVVIGDASFLDFVTSQHTQIGYNILQAIIKTLIDSSSFFFIVFAFLGMILRYYFYKSFISIQDIGIVIFAFLVHEFLRKDCVQIRNGFASAMVLFSIVYAYKGQKKIAALLIFLGMTFHTAALVALPILFIKKDTSEKYEMFIIIVFTSVLTMSALGIFDNIIRNLLSKSAEAQQYLDSGIYGEQRMSLSNPIILKQLIISLFLLYNRKKYFEDKLIFFLSQIYLLSTIYYYFFNCMEIFSARFGSLLYAVEAPLLLLLIYKSKTNIQPKKICLCILYFILLFYNTIAMEPFIGWNFELK